MIPTLYEEYETQYISNGLGRLSDAISCVITQNNSGIYELNMEYPIDGLHAEEITNNRIIYAQPEKNKGPQPFRIRNIEKTIDRKMAITARHNCYDLNYYACKQFGEIEISPYQVTPSLYDDNEEYIGVLRDIIIYNVAASSTKWTLTLTYPSAGVLANQLTTSNYIYAQPAIERDLVMFDITEVIAPTLQDPTYKVTAEADVVPYVPREYNRMSVAHALNHISSYTNLMQSCPFNFSVRPTTPDDTWITSQRQFWNDIPKSVKPLLQGSEGSVVDVFGGQWEFDHYNCILHESRGSDNGVQYRYGKNITSIKERINIDEIYTHAFSFWKGTASSSTDTEEGEYYTKTGTILNILDSQYSAMFPTQRTLIIDASDNYEKEPTVEQLDSYTRKYVSNHSSGTPTVTIEVSIVDLASTKEYEDILSLEQVNLYDTVTVVFPWLGINVKSKVTEIQYDALKEKNNKVSIGNITTKLSNIIAQNKRDIVQTKYDLKKWADRAIERATQAVSGWNGGNIRKNYNATDHKQQSVYIMNADNMDNATKAIKLDAYGIGISDSGAEGNYIYMVNLSGRNIFFTDEFAEDGDTNASFLQRGEISSGDGQNRSYWNIEDNEIYLILKGLRSTEDVTFERDLTVQSDTNINGNLAVDGTFNLKVNGALKDVGDWLDDLEQRVTNLESNP